MALNAFFIFIIFYLDIPDILNIDAEPSASLGALLTYVINYLVLNTILVMAISSLIQTLSKKLNEEKVLSSQLKNKNEEYAEAIKRAEASDKLKSEFLANMSHEIRTPMNGIIGMVELLLNSGLDYNQKTYAKVIRKSAEALLGLINQLLDFSKIESGKIELENRPFDLVSLFNEIIKLMKPGADEKGLFLSFYIDPDIPVRLTGDSNKIRQILLNLTGNAVKFTSQGSVVLKAELCPDMINSSDPGIKADTNMCCIKFIVEDTGIGIEKDKQEFIFDQFTQTDASITRKYGGTGLGLAICRRLVQLMGGKIGVQSIMPDSAEQVKGGSVFWFTLNFKIENEINSYESDSSYKADLGENVNSENVNSGNFRILLVEDNIVNQQVVLGMLGKSGFKIKTALNGIEALELTENNMFDLILMDLQMPEMDGYETTRIIRAGGRGKFSEHNKNIPIIAITAHVMNSDKEKCMSCGMNDFIEKPFSFDAFTKLIFNWAAKSARVEGENFADWNKQDFLRRMQMDPAIAEKIILLAIDNLPEQISLLKEYLKNRDYKAVCIQAHTIKGSMLNIGAEQLACSASIIENRAQENDIKACETEFEYMLEHADKFINLMKEWLKDKTIY
jgi:signal transduction histidine kinase/DNA-binding NarL/FixJ family response regulator